MRLPGISPTSANCSARAMYKTSIVIAVFVLVSACSGQEPNVTNAAAVPADVATPDGAEESLAPTPNYRDREGDRYFYVAEVSEDDRKKGKAAGEVIEYRFLGEKADVFTLEQVAENGSPLGRLECRRDCQIMKLSSVGQVSRLPYGNSSIASAAMEDAINGFLQPAKPPPAPIIVKRIPAAFIGKWNPDPSDCGIGYNDAAVFVAAEKLTFYESGLDVTAVEILSPSRIKVTGPLTDEEGSTATMTYTLSLQGGKLLVDDNTARTRCSGDGP